MENLDGQYTEVEFDEELEEPSDDTTIPADPRVKNFTYTIHDDEIYYRENSMMYKAEMNETAQERVRGMIGIRQTMREIIDAQMANMPGGDIEALQAVLNSRYDDFTKKYGIINSHGNKRAFKLDAYHIIETTLNLRVAAVRDKKYDPDGEEYYVVNNEETILAQEKQTLLKDKFREWVFDDPQRRERLVRKYNDEYNNLRPREYDGSNLRFYGMNPEISLHEHKH